MKYILHLIAHTCFQHVPECGSPSATLKRIYFANSCVDHQLNVSLIYDCIDQCILSGQQYSFLLLLRVSFIAFGFAIIHRIVLCTYLCTCTSKNLYYRRSCRWLLHKPGLSKRLGPHLKWAVGVTMSRRNGYNRGTVPVMSDRVMPGHPTVLKLWCLGWCV